MLTSIVKLAPKAKQRLIRWMLLLQEFDLEIRVKSWAENLVADHLSIIERVKDFLPIQDDFHNEKLLQLLMLLSSLLIWLTIWLMMLKVMPSIICGMIHIRDVFPITRFNLF